MTDTGRAERSSGHHILDTSLRKGAQLAPRFETPRSRTRNTAYTQFPALDEELLERRVAGIVAEEGIEQLPGALGRERVQPHLTVVDLAAPSVPVLGAIVHEQQQARRGQAVD